MRMEELEVVLDVDLLGGVVQEGKRGHPVDLLLALGNLVAGDVVHHVVDEPDKQIVIPTQLLCFLAFPSPAVVVESHVYDGEGVECLWVSVPVHVWLLHHVVCGDPCPRPARGAGRESDEGGALGRLGQVVWHHPCAVALRAPPGLPLLGGSGGVQDAPQEVVGLAAAGHVEVEEGAPPELALDLKRMLY